MVVLRFSFRCDVAGCAGEEHDITPIATDTFRGQVYAPTLPKGWRLLGNQILGQELVCPRHDVTIDGADYATALHPIPKEG